MKTLWILVLFVVAVMFTATVQGCATSAHDILHLKLVATAEGVAQIGDLVERDYRDKARALREGIHARGGTLADYEADIKPIDEEYERRVRALGSLTTILRSGADLNDTIGQEMTLENATRTARNVLQAVRGLLETLEQGAGLAPGIKIPAAVKRAFALLEQFAEMGAGAATSPATEP